MVASWFANVSSEKSLFAGLKTNTRTSKFNNRMRFHYTEPVGEERKFEQLNRHRDGTIEKDDAMWKRERERDQEINVKINRDKSFIALSDKEKLIQHIRSPLFSIIFFALFSAQVSIVRPTLHGCFWVRIWCRTNCAQTSEPWNPILRAIFHMPFTQRKIQRITSRNRIGKKTPYDNYYV